MIRLPAQTAQQELRVNVRKGHQRTKADVRVTSALFPNGDQEKIALRQ